MGIGAGILLIAIGAILAFAVNWHVSGLDLHVVGWVLMIVGVLGLILFFGFWNRRGGGRAVVTNRAYPAQSVPPGGVVEQQRVYEDPPM
jgi:Domain of unknown function (DUF6458)